VVFVVLNPRVEFNRPAASRFVPGLLDERHQARPEFLLRYTNPNLLGVASMLRPLSIRPEDAKVLL
jgi:hypothetical protein